MYPWLMKYKMYSVHRKGGGCFQLSNMVKLNDIAVICSRDMLTDANKPYLWLFDRDMGQYRRLGMFD